MNQKNPSNIAKDRQMSHRIRFGLGIAGIVLALVFGLYARSFMPAKPVSAAYNLQSAVIHTVMKAPISTPIATPLALSTNFAAEQALLPAAVAQDQRVNGILMRVGNLNREGDRLRIDVCFTLPDDQDWTIWNATLDLGGAQFSDPEITLLEARYRKGNGLDTVLYLNDLGHPDFREEPSTVDEIDPGAQAGHRCDTLSFKLPVETKQEGAATLRIDWINVDPSQADNCAFLLPRLQKVLQRRGIKGITLGRRDADGVFGAFVTKKPDGMNMEEAQRLALDDDVLLEATGIQGPWIFLLK